MLIDMFKEGGFGMFPTLIFGVVLLVAAAHFAWSPERRRLAFIAGMWATELVQIAHATWSDFAAVANAASDPQMMPDATMVRILFTGFKECTRPGLFGGLFLVLALLFVSIGLARASAKVMEA